MENYYDLLGLQPGCSKRQLKKAYHAAIRRLETGDLIGEERLEQAYRNINADRKHQKLEKKKHGFWKTSKESRARFTGPHGSEAAINVIKRFGFRELICALGVILISWAFYLLCSFVTPNLFPVSQYPLLAKTFSQRLVAAVTQLTLYVVLVIAYICHSLRRRTNGLRRLRLGFIFGCALLIVAFFVPQNQIGNTVSLLRDMKPLKQNTFAVTNNILLEDAFLQTKNSFGNLYTYKAGKSNKVFIPESLLEDPEGTVHQAVVTFLPHTHAAAKVNVRAMENHMFGSIGDCFFLDFPTNKNIKSIYLRRSDATLVIERTDSIGVVKAKLSELDLKDKNGQPVPFTITADKMAAAILPDDRLLVSFTVEDDDGHNTCVAAVIDQITGAIMGHWRLKGEFPFKLFSCAHKYYLFTQSLVKTSFVDRVYYMQIYDPAQNKIVHTAPESYSLGSAPHIGSFDSNCVWISKHSNGEDPIGKFTVPKDLMN